MDFKIRKVQTEGRQPAWQQLQQLVTRSMARGPQPPPPKHRSRSSQSEIKMTNGEFVATSHLLQHQIAEEKLRVETEKFKKEALAYQQKAWKLKADITKLT